MVRRKGGSQRLGTPAIHTFLPVNYTIHDSALSAFTRWRHHWLWWTASNCSLLLIYQPRKDERLSRPSWLTYGGWFTRISGHPSAVGRSRDRESLLVKDRRSTTAPHNQSNLAVVYCITVCRRTVVFIVNPPQQLVLCLPSLPATGAAAISVAIAN